MQTRISKSIAMLFKQSNSPLWQHRAPITSAMMRSSRSDSSLDEIQGGSQFDSDEDHYEENDSQAPTRNATSDDEDDFVEPAGIYSQEVDKVSTEARMTKVENEMRTLRSQARRHNKVNQDMQKEIGKLRDALGPNKRHRKYLKTQGKNNRCFTRRGGAKDEVDGVNHRDSDADLSVFQRRGPSQYFQDVSRNSSAPANPTEAARQPPPAAQPLPAVTHLPEAARQPTPAATDARGTANSYHAAPTAAAQPQGRHFLTIRPQPPSTEPPRRPPGQMWCGSPATPTEPPPPPPVHSVLDEVVRFLTATMVVTMAMLNIVCFPIDGTNRWDIDVP